MNGKANVGIYHCTNKIGSRRILKKTQIDQNELTTLAYFNNGKSLYKKLTKSFPFINHPLYLLYGDFKTCAELIKYCVDTLEDIYFYRF